MAVSRMRNEKYAILPLLVAESLMNWVTGQIPCSTERISGSTTILQALAELLQLQHALVLFYYT